MLHIYMEYILDKHIVSGCLYHISDWPAVRTGPWSIIIWFITLTTILHVLVVLTDFFGFLMTLETKYKKDLKRKNNLKQKRKNRTKSHFVLFFFLTAFYLYSWVYTNVSIVVI